MYVPGSINSWNTSTYIYISYICTYSMNDYSCPVYTIRRIHFGFCVPFATLCSCEPAAAAPTVIQFLSCCCCCCWCPPLRCCASSCRCCLCASCSNNFGYFLLFPQNIYMENFSDKAVFFLSPQVAGTSGWRGNLYETRPNRQFSDRYF